MGSQPQRAFSPEPSINHSFRDPGGVLVLSGGRIYRIVNGVGRADLDAFQSSESARRWAADGSLVPTSVLTESEKLQLLERPEVARLYRAIGGETILEHERIPFPSFPYEWAPEMLHAAAELTLELALALLPEGLGLKDATPYNILFRGPRPVFIDVLSFERRTAGDPTWLPYAQFIRTFVLPLLANRDFGLALDQALLARRDGLEPEDVYRWLNPLQRLRPPYFSLVSMPVWLSKRQRADDMEVYRKRVLPDPERARFTVELLLKGLQRTCRRVAPRTGKSSVWTGYMETNNNYTAEHFAGKERFVDLCLGEHRPRRVLDVGCNTGHFSALASRRGAEVVAIDYDSVVVGQVWRRAQAEKLNILPLVVNLTRPSPGVGWKNCEWSSFLDRAAGAFDAVLMLAVIHHMLVTERVPMGEIVDLAASLTRDLLIIEFVGQDDSMFRRLTRGREQLYRHITAEAFEAECVRRFDILERQHVDGTQRWLYRMRRRTQ